MGDKTQALISILKLQPVVPVLVIKDLAHAVPLARALVAGGLKAIEITLRTPVALEAIREAGPGGHFFGTAHTMARYETAFHTPLLSNWDNYPNWRERGGIDARARANTVWKSLLNDYDEPLLPPDIAEALDAYVARRKAEGGAPMN